MFHADFLGGPLHLQSRKIQELTTWIEHPLSADASSAVTTSVLTNDEWVTIPKPTFNTIVYRVELIFGRCAVYCCDSEPGELQVKFFRHFMQNTDYGRRAMAYTFWRNALFMDNVRNIQCPNEVSSFVYKLLSWRGQRKYRAAS